MKSSLSAVAFSLAALVAAPAHADTVSYRFGGTFDSVLQPIDGWQTVPSASSHGFVFQPGQTFTGILSYSTDLSKVHHGDIPGYQAYTGKISISVAVPSTGFALQARSSGSGGGAGVADNHPTLGDAVGFASDVNFHNDDHYLRVEFFDTSNSVFNDLAFPTRLSLADFDSATFQLELPYTTQAIRVLGSVTSLEQISAVPEPDTWLMLAAGLGLLGWTRYRGQQQARRG